ncbi:MAG: DUF763 domain-containing protein [bacterium]
MLNLRNLSLILTAILWATLLGAIVYSHMVFFPVYLGNLPDSAVLVHGPYALHDERFWTLIHPLLSGTAGVRVPQRGSPVGVLDSPALTSRHLRMPAHHDVRPKNVDLKRLGAVLAVAYERDLHDFAELLLLEKLGPRTLQSLALVAEVVHGAPSRFNDPARFSFAHGGKDRYPFPVPLKTYDESLDFLRSALDTVRTGNGSNRVTGKEKLEGLRRLERFARTVETRLKPEANFGALIAHENKISPSLDGRSMFDDPPGKRFNLNR